MCVLWACLANSVLCEEAEDTLKSIYPLFQFTFIFISQSDIGTPFQAAGYDVTNLFGQYGVSSGRIDSSKNVIRKGTQ